MFNHIILKAFASARLHEGESEGVIRGLNGVAGRARDCTKDLLSVLVLLSSNLAAGCTFLLKTALMRHRSLARD